MGAPIFQPPAVLPSSKVNARASSITRSSRMAASSIRQNRQQHRGPAHVGGGGELNRVVALGCNYFESKESIAEHERTGKPRVGIGTNCRIENAIIDKERASATTSSSRPSGKPERGSSLYFIQRRHRGHPQRAAHPGRHSDLSGEQWGQTCVPNLLRCIGLKFGFVSVHEAEILAGTVATRQHVDHRRGAPICLKS